MRGVKLASETAETLEAALSMARPIRAVRERLRMVISCGDPVWYW